MMVNPTKGKAQSNVRSSGTDEAIVLFPAFELTIERGLEIMADDESRRRVPRDHAQLLFGVNRAPAQAGTYLDSTASRTIACRNDLYGRVLQRHAKGADTRGSAGSET
jgi:predicted membrane GTPase involved in stress response